MPSSGSVCGAGPAASDSAAPAVLYVHAAAVRERGAHDCPVWHVDLVPLEEKPVVFLSPGLLREVRKVIVVSLPALSRSPVTHCPR